MRQTNLKYSLAAALLLLVSVMSCKDDFSESDLVAEQNKIKLEELKAQMRKDSLEYLLSLEELEYRKYLDSLKRVDSLAFVNFGDGAFLPYTYELQVINGSITSVRNGRTSETKAFDTDVTVTITQYGVKRTQTSQDGLFTFDNIGVGAIHGTINAPGFTTFDFVVDASLPYNFFRDLVEDLDGAAVGNGAGPNVTAGSYLDMLISYFNQRSFGNDFPIFATEGPSTSTITGRAFIETDLTNRTKEVAPAGTQIVATIDINNAAFTDRYFLDGDAAIPTNDEDAISLNSIFNPQSWAIGFLGTTTTNATGDYTLNVPGSPDGVPVKIEYSDVVADKTFYLQSNGDVTEITRRNVYGPNMLYSTVPAITLAPTVSFFAGGGAVASVNISGDGSVSDIDLVSGGQNFQGTPRVVIAAPPAGGVRATATATVANGRVTDINITNAGSGYTATPAVTITEGTGAVVNINNFLISNASNVADVILNNAGSYNDEPNVVFWYDNNPTNGIFDVGEELVGGNAPIADAVLQASCNCIEEINVTDPGNGLAANPNVLITSGTGAAIQVTVDGTGVVSNVTILEGGAFFTDEPTFVTPAGAGGNGDAVLTAILTSGVITSVAITDAGTGYNPGVYILSNNNGLIETTELASAQATAVWTGLGIADMDVVNQGTLQVDGRYYTNVPELIISEPDYSGPQAVQATGVVILGADGRVTGVNITNPGLGYYGVPVFTIVSGSGATANATFANQVITEVEVLAGGDGYKVAPQVMIVDPTGAGSGATATATIQSGRVTSINLTNAGSGYINGATVIILDPGFSYNPSTFSLYANPALANVIVENGGITLIEVYQEGANYPAGTEVRINTVKGSGATATATVTGGRVVDVVIGSGGLGYVGNNFSRSLNAANNPDVGSSAPVTLLFDIYTTTLADLLFNGQFTEYNSKSGIRRVVDIEYGTGRNQD